MSFDSYEFMRGQKDCKNGVPHREGQTESYDRGYSTQHQMEQILNARTDKQVKSAL